MLIRFNFSYSGNLFLLFYLCFFSILCEAPAHGTTEALEEHRQRCIDGHFFVRRVEGEFCKPPFPNTSYATHCLGQGSPAQHK